MFKHLLVMLGLDGRSFVGGVNKMQAFARTAGKNISDALGSRLAGLLAGVGIAKLTHDTIALAGKLNDLSQRLGINTEKLQEFGFAAQQNGSSLDSFAAFLERVNVAREEALSGNAKALDAFKELGVTIDDLKSKRVQDLTNQIANKVKDGDIQKIIGPLREIGGRGAGELVAAFKAGLEEAGAEAQASGLIMREETIAQLDVIGDRFDTLGMQLKSNLAPGIAIVADGIQSFIDHIRRIGAFLGALTSSVNFDKVGKAGEDWSFENFKKGGMIGELFRQLGSASTEADKAVKEFNESIVKREEGIIKAREVAKQTRDAQAQGEFDEEKKKKKSKGGGQSRDVNELQRVGAFISNPNQTLETLQRENNQLQKQIARNTEKIANMRQTGKGVLYS